MALPTQARGAASGFDHGILPLGLAFYGHWRIGRRPGGRNQPRDWRRQLKRDESAARQCWALQAHQRPREKKLRLADVKEMFMQIKDHA